MEAGEAQSDDREPVEPDFGEPDRPLRRGLFGYRRADVDEALGSREAELAELRQDIAALWLAFAQHDRMIREALSLPEQGLTPAPPPSPEPAPSRSPAPSPAPAASPSPPATPPQGEPAAAPPLPGEAPEAEPSPSVAHQLSELDDVLAAIEMATQTLEQTYAEEIGAGSEAAAAEQSSAAEAADEGSDEAVAFGEEERA